MGFVHGLAGVMKRIEANARACDSGRARLRAAASSAPAEQMHGVCDRRAPKACIGAPCAGNAYGANGRRREWPHSHPMSCARTRGPRIGARDDNHDAGTHRGASYAIDGTTQPSDNAIIKPNGTAFIGTAQRARA
nr:hypothetical protein [Burkholderia pseudomallei]